MTDNTLTTLVIGDPHFKINNIKDTDLMTLTILRIAKIKSPDIIIILGDTLDRHETMHLSPATRAKKFIWDLSRIAHTFVLIGNHDIKNNKQYLSDEHPFVEFKLQPHSLRIQPRVTPRLQDE